MLIHEVISFAGLVRPLNPEIVLFWSRWKCRSIVEPDPIQEKFKEILYYKKNCGKSNLPVNHLIVKFIWEYFLSKVSDCTRIATFPSLLIARNWNLVLVLCSNFFYTQLVPYFLHSGRFLYRSWQYSCFLLHWQRFDISYLLENKFSCFREKSFLYIMCNFAFLRYESHIIWWLGINTKNI